MDLCNVCVCISIVSCEKLSIICIAKNNFKDDFLNIQIPDFKILSKPYINGNITYSAFRWCINLNLKKLTLKTGFVLQGHIFSGSHIFSM